MRKLIELRELFDMEYGKDNLLVRDTVDRGKTPLISSKGTDNGVVGYVDIEPTYRNVINVPRTGTVCYAFLQERGCCINSDSIVLSPKRKFSREEMMYFVLLIRREVFRYSYGRKVTPSRLGRTLVEINMPSWVYKKKKFVRRNLNARLLNEKTNLSSRKWKYFLYGEVFAIERGFYNKRPTKEGELKFISASVYNNGVTDYLDKSIVEKVFKGNCLTVVNNGHAGAAFYQPEEFTCSHDVNILRIKDGHLDVYISMFLIPLIGKEKYRFNYGRKWRFDRMSKSKIMLPVDKDGRPDWIFMRNYIKSLPYSKSLN